MPRLPFAAVVPAIGLLCCGLACQCPPHPAAGPDLEWAGTYGPPDDDAKGVGYLELETFRTTGRPPEELELSFSRLAWPEQAAGECRFSGRLSTVLEAPCQPRSEEDAARCPRALRLTRVSGGFEVLLVGAGWQAACDRPGSARPRVGKLLRVDPFEALVEPVVESARHSDLGSAGGNVLFLALGEDPDAAVRGLAKLVREELRAQHVDPSLLRLTTASELVERTYGALLGRCGFRLPTARYASGPAGECTLDDARAAAAVTARDFREASEALQREIDRQFPVDGG